MLDEELFLRAITVTIQNWPSFQVAINNGMGGPNTDEKVTWMCRMIVELFKDNPHGTVQADDVLEYLDTVINNEFDTIIEDGSAEMVCSSIVGYYNRITSGDKDFVTGKLESMVAKQALLRQTLQQQQQQQASTTEHGGFVVTLKEQNTAEDTEMTEADGGERVDDGWTVVRKKR